MSPSPASFSAAIVLLGVAGGLIPEAKAVNVPENCLKWVKDYTNDEFENLTRMNCDEVDQAKADLDSASVQRSVSPKQQEDWDSRVASATASCEQA
eukprot:CAMPEP_0203945114 /NCGR_PEP_ID=MMETSP0359-20131031/80712_1 /ASSEMBLY_ACC=CAM_ASM_000338 /TAXON_ID=268821 /ORGANISM="Scrippsiella Hangoei, Strain SHTV-5" /LENGTH=95 /DNA_ID=CAMNT_0050876229 /DNA_START=20 /DNA_END=304 /DNA_ORIENTATION=-